MFSLGHVSWVCHWLRLNTRHVVCSFTKMKKSLLKGEPDQRERRPICISGDVLLFFGQLIKIKLSELTVAEFVLREVWPVSGERRRRTLGAKREESSFGLSETGQLL